MAEGTCESKAFASKQARLKSCINPDDLTVKCYSKGIISKEEFEEVENDMLSRPKKASLLLKAIGQMIEKDPAYFEKFLTVLGSESTNKKLVDELRAAKQDALLEANLSELPSPPSGPVAAAEKSHTKPLLK